MLKNFILSKKNHNENILEENIAVRGNENNQSDNEIVSLQLYLIAKITDFHIIKIREAFYKKRIKGIMEISKGKKVNDNI